MIQNTTTRNSQDPLTLKIIKVFFAKSKTKQKLMIFLSYKTQTYIFLAWESFQPFIWQLTHGHPQRKKNTEKKFCNEEVLQKKVLCVLSICVKKKEYINSVAFLLKSFANDTFFRVWKREREKIGVWIVWGQGRYLRNQWTLHQHRGSSFRWSLHFCPCFDSHAVAVICYHQQLLHFLPMVYWANKCDLAPLPADDHQL